jgi:hypothetical protein
MRSIYVQYGNTAPKLLNVQEERTLRHLRLELPAHFVQLVGVPLKRIGFCYSNKVDIIPSTTLLASLDIWIEFERAPLKVLQLKRVKQRRVNFTDIKHNIDAISLVTGIQPTWAPWLLLNFDTRIHPSPEFCCQFARILRGNEGQGRIAQDTLELLLQDVLLLKDFDNAMGLYEKVPITVDKRTTTSHTRLYGVVEYVVARRKTVEIPHIVATPVKTMWNKEHHLQAFAKMSALHTLHRRKESPQCNVWGIITDGHSWQLLHIDHTGKLWKTLDMRIGADLINFGTIRVLYQLVHGIVASAFQL